jgi:hypothetical protein
MVEVRWKLVKDANGKPLKDPKTGKKAQYDPIFTYAPLDPESSWARRMKELLTAIGVKLTGTVDIKTGTEALLRLKEDKDQDGNYRPNVAKILKLGSVNSDEEDEEEEDESEVDLSELNRTHLKKFIKDNELDVTVKKSMSDDDLRAAIAEAIGGSDDEEEDEEEEEDGEEEVDLSELDRSELKAFIKENKLDVKVLKNDSDDDLRAKIAEAMGGDEEEEGEEEEEEDGGDNYDELTPDQLRQECRDRELDDKGQKKTLIARLRKDDQEEPV